MAKMLLPNGCSCSYPTVVPGNWLTGGQSLLDKNWVIQYYFMDPEYWDKNPEFAKKYPYGYPIRVKGMNKFTNLKDRRDATKALLENELTMLREHAYNPMAKIQTIKVTPTAASEYEISPDLPWLKALDKVMVSLGVKCKKDFRSTIKIVGEASRQLNYDTIAIKDIRRKNIKIILEHLKATRNKPAEGDKKARHWGPASYNRFRAHLISLFKELIELEAIEYDPVTTIRKMEEIPTKKEVLTEEEQKTISDYLKANNYTFWRYMQIFFHSGARSTELLLLQAKDVDLKGQSFTIMVNKGRKKRHSTRAIMNVALPLWQELMANAKPDDYIFSVNLEPGPDAISPDQVKRRWRLHVKEKLGIDKDFYSLKHLHTDQIASTLGLEAAAAHDGHTSTAMVRKIYAVGHEEREREKLRKLDIRFGGAG